jgi:hypothetical protein
VFLSSGSQSDKKKKSRNGASRVHSEPYLRQLFPGALIWTFIWVLQRGEDWEEDAKHLRRGKLGSQPQTLT